VPSSFNFRGPLLAKNEEGSSASYKKESTLAAILILAVLYAAAGRVGLLTAIPPGYVTAIWPSSGIALAAVLLRDKRIWPGIWLGSFAINNWAYVRYTGSRPSLLSVLAAALIAFGASTAALCGAFMLRRITRSTDLFRRTGRVIGFIAIGVMGSCLISATIGTTSLFLLGLIPWAHFSRTWWTWWLGDAAGVLVITPLLLTWTKTIGKFQGWRPLEALVLLVLLIATSSIAFSYQRYPLSYIVLPVLIAAALRFRQAGATAAIALAFFIGAIYTTRHRGPFAAQNLTQNESLLLLGGFMLLTGFTTLILAAAWSECEEETLEVASAACQRQLIQVHVMTIEAENLRKTRDLEEAAELQLSMLPTCIPEIPGLEVSAHMHSTREVGGDYYDILPVKGRTDDCCSYLFCVADVSGKGLVASLLMSNFQTMLMTLQDESLLLAETASRLGALIYAMPRSRYITAIMVELDPQTGIGHYVNAGHISGILLRAEGDLEWLPSTGFPLGMFADVTYHEETFRFRRGDVLALLSDGFTDAMDVNGQEFGEARLADYLRGVCCRSAKDIVAGAFEEVNHFVGSAPQFDDITLVVLKRHELLN
jgi:serine phosphatase RsbU (regulator of sigma subunit)